MPSFLVAQASDIRWASRWDTYLLMMDDQIHWFSIINSLMIVLFLTGMVAMIMMRTLHRDISKYNQLETVEEAQEETGWKLVRILCLLFALLNCLFALIKTALYYVIRYMGMSSVHLLHLRHWQCMWALACRSLA